MKLLEDVQRIIFRFPAIEADEAVRTVDHILTVIRRSVIKPSLGHLQSASMSFFEVIPSLTWDSIPSCPHGATISQTSPLAAHSFFLILDPRHLHQSPHRSCSSPINHVEQPTHTNYSPLGALSMDHLFPPIRPYSSRRDSSTHYHRRHRTGNSRSLPVPGLLG